MAQFQKTHPREDTIQRHPLTMEDVAFLKDLQHALNTQDTMGNADPRFWVIIQGEDESCTEADADASHIFSQESASVIADDLDGFVGHLQDRYGDRFSAEYNPKLNVWDVRLDDVEDDYVVNTDDLLKLLERAGIYDYSISYSRTVKSIVHDTLFLTHADCEDHLRRYHYNYKPDAHAFAMTAIRSPQFERLISVLQTVDWDAVAKEGGDAP